MGRARATRGGFGRWEGETRRNRRDGAATNEASELVVSDRCTRLISCTANQRAAAEPNYRELAFVRNLCDPR